MRPRGDDDDDDGDVDVAVSERPLHLNAELERPNAERRDGVREADETVAREVPTPENATELGIRHRSSDDGLDLLDVLAMDYLDVLTTSERAPATRYCSSCRKHLVEAHFRSPETKTCVVCLRMHKTYQRRRRRLKNKRQRRQSDD